MATLLETGLVGPPNAEKSHTCFQSHFTQCCKRGWVSPPPTLPSVSTRNLSKCNRSLKDPVRGAGSAQVKIRSYRNRQSGNLARQVKNAFPGSEALRKDLLLHVPLAHGNIIMKVTDKMRVNLITDGNYLDVFISCFDLLISFWSWMQGGIDDVMWLRMYHYCEWA